MKRFVIFAALAGAALNAADEPLPEVLRALENLGSASGGRPSEDSRQIAFVTTLFGSRQAAVMPLEGGYPLKLTAEPSGIVAVRWSPTDPHALIAVALREGKRRLLLLDDEAGPAVELDPAPGDQLPGGFTRDGKKLFYGVVDGSTASLRQVTIGPARKVTEVKPGAIASPSPLPATPASQQGSPSGAASPPTGSVPAPPTMRSNTPAPAPSSGTATPPVARPAPVALDEALRGLSAVGPVSPDGRSLLVQTRRRGDEVIWTVDLANARAEPLTPHEGSARFRLPRWSADGRTVYVLTDAGRQTLGVDAVTIASRERKAIYAPSRPVEAFALTDDGHRLAVAEEANGQTVFSILELPGLRAQPLPQPPGGALLPAPEARARPVLDINAVALAVAGVAAIELNPRGPLLRPASPDSYAADLAAALKSLRARDDLDARKPLLVAVGSGAAAAAKLLDLEPDGFAGVVGIDAEPRLSGGLAVESSSSDDLRKLVRYARERLK